MSMKTPTCCQRSIKPDMAGTIELIKEYLRSYHGVVRATLAYVIWKTITVQTMSEYPMYATSNNKMIATMLHLHPSKNKILSEKG